MSEKCSGWYFSDKCKPWSKSVFHFCTSCCGGRMEASCDRASCGVARTSIRRCWKVSATCPVSSIRMTEQADILRMRSFSCLFTRFPPMWMTRSGRKSRCGSNCSSQVVRQLPACPDMISGRTSRELFSSIVRSAGIVPFSYWPTMTIGSRADCMAWTVSSESG